MKQLATTVVAILTAITVTACNTGGPTAPSAVTRSGAPPATSFTVTGGNSNGNSADASFAAYASSFNEAQLTFARMAHSRGDLWELQMWALQLIGDFSNAQDQLRESMNGQGVGSGNLNASDQRLHDRLNAQSGSHFDLLYVEQLIDALQSAITRYQSHANAGNTSAMRVHAGDRAARMATLLARARDIAGRLSANREGADNR